jgi:hypothetical protein
LFFLKKEPKTLALRGSHHILLILLEKELKTLALLGLNELVELIFTSKRRYVCKLMLILLAFFHYFAEGPRNWLNKQEQPHYTSHWYCYELKPSQT